MELSTCRVCLKSSTEAHVSIFKIHEAEKMNTILKYITGIDVNIYS